MHFSLSIDFSRHSTSKYKKSSEILQVKFQATEIKKIYATKQVTVFSFFFFLGFPVHVKCMFPLHFSILSVPLICILKKQIMYIIGNDDIGEMVLVDLLDGGIATNFQCVK